VEEEAEDVGETEAEVAEEEEEEEGEKKAERFWEDVPNDDPRLMGRDPPLKEGRTF